MNKFSAKQISEIVAGQIIGNPDKTVTAFSKIEEAGPDSLSFLGNDQYSPFLFSTKAGVLIISKHLLPKNFTNNDMTLIVVPDAYQAFTKLLQLYESMIQKPSGLEQPHHLGKNVTLGKDIYIGSFAYIGNNCTIGKNVKIYPHVYIGDRVTIGDNTILYPGVKIYHDCRIGQNCIIHSGTVIGSDGFGFIPNSDHQREKVPQIGNVIIEDNVEIGSNVSIDRATIGSTIIRKGVKLDNLIQIAHNVEIGENTVIAAQTGIAGSTKIGKNCMIGGQVGIVGHISIADEVKIAAQSGIGSSIKEKGAIVQGSPAFGIGEYKKSYVLFKNLPKLAETIEEIKKKTNLK